MKNWLLNGILAVSAIVLVVFSVTSCKEPGPPKAEITVLDSAGVNKMSGATVHLHSIVSGNIIDITDKTDGSGKVYITLKLPANLNCDITMPNPAVPGDNLEGGGYVIFEEGKTTEKTFNIK
jgi:hypothetical protein